MDPNENKSRKTNIIEDPLALEQSLQQGKGKGKKKKPTGGFKLSGPQDASSSKLKASPKASPKAKATAAQDEGPRFYEASGLKIPLYERSGKKRPHARASAYLRSSKNEDELLDIVEAYAGADKRQELKDKGLTKARLANWIEEAETRALGRNPKSQLEPEQAEASEADDTDDALEQALATSTAESNKGKAKVATEDDGMLNAQSISMSSPQVAQPGDRKRRASDGGSDCQPRPKRHQRDFQANLESISRKEIQAETRLTGKREHHSASIPTLSQQTVRKSTTYNTPNEPMYTSNPTNVSSSNSKKQNRGRQIHLEGPMAQPPKHAESIHGATSESEEQIDAQDLLQAFMGEAGLDPSQPEHSTKVVTLPEQGEVRVLTASSNHGTGQATLHDTGIPKWYKGYDGSQASKTPAPYLKEGKHGPGGDFDNDPDRATGKGHDYDPQDSRRYQEYMEYRAAFYKKYPTYPKLAPSVHVEAEVKAVWDNEEAWYRAFREKYPGSRLDQWPCGCQKLGYEEEGESEEE